MGIQTQEEFFLTMLHMAAGVTRLDGDQGHNLLRS